MSKFNKVFKALGLAPKEPKINIDTREDKRIAEERLALQRQQTESLAAQTEFQKKQSQFLLEQQSASVPKPPPAPETNDQVAPTISADAEANSGLQSRRKGRRSLRIPLSTNAGSTASGVNVPRG